MKKKSIIWSFFLAASILAASCATDSIASKPAAVVITKTPEMKSFESALREYFKSNREETATSSTARRSATDKDKLMAEQAQALLTHIGVAQTNATGRMQLSDKEIIHIATKAYNQKLSELYKEQNK